MPPDKLFIPDRSLLPVEKYIKIFPEWLKVDEKSWVSMCERLEQYTLEPKIPTYVHVLLAGATVIANINAILILLLIILLTSTIYIIKTRKTLPNRKLLNKTTVP